MAKSRRVVRKVPPPGGHYFDEQLWPIYIALVVLGGFLMGVSAAYLPLAGVAWYRTAWPSLVGIPVCVAAAMVAFRLIDNRFVRRSLQLSIVLAAILHVALVVQMIQTRIFAGLFERPVRQREILERRPIKVVPEYHPSQLVPEEDRPRQDFERPVETRTPEPTREPEQIVRQPAAEDRSPAEPQPVPTPEQQQSAEPNVVSRQQPNEVAPRLAAQASQLSRQLAPSQSRQSQPIGMPQEIRQPAAGGEAQPTSTAASRQATSNPQLAERKAELDPQSTTDPAAPERRQSPAPEQPAVAAAPSPTPSRQPRQTARPDMATAVPAPNNTPAASNASAVEITPRASLTRRTAAEVTAAERSNLPATEQQSSVREQPAARLARIDAQPSPAATASPTATPTLTRQMASVPSLPAVSHAADAPATSVSASTSAELSPTSTATRRTAAASPQAAPATGEPRPLAVASAASLTASSVPLSRAASGSASANSPAAASSLPIPAASRRTESAVTNVVTRVGDVPANSGPQPATAADAGPSAASVSRQTAASSPAATRTQPASAVAAAGSSPATASGGVPRAQSAAVPTIDPSGEPGASPRRAMAAAAATNSPTAVESPAAALANSGLADPSAQPSRVALSRSQAGTAGAGRSANIDSSLPGGTSPALVASGAARRAEATQSAPTGDSLSPAAPAQIARSRAGAELPTATIRAQSLPSATVAGGSQVAEVTASSSAALARSDAAARSDAVTAAKGTGEVDLGPTLVVAEAGMGRASGGGQANPSFQSPSPALVRQPSPGGAPQMSLAADVGPFSAPAGTSGGAPPAAEVLPSAIAAARSAGAAQAGGGPSAGQSPGPLTVTNSAALLADAPLSRADSAEGQAGGEAAAGVPAIEDEDERARRLARAALGGAPAVAVAGPALADVAASPMGVGGDGGAPPSEGLRATQIAAARQSRDGGAPAGGAPQAASAPESNGASGGETASLVSIARAEAADGAPDDPAAGGGTNSPARQAGGQPLTGSATAVEIPEVGPTSAVAQAEQDHLLGGVGRTPMSRRSGDALAADIRGPDGLAGLGTEFTPDVGINTRQARADSLNLQLRSARFLRSQVGGLPAVSTTAIVASDAFSSRGARLRGDIPAGGRGAPGPQTEEAIERGLAFLARYQAPTGGWSLQGYPEGAQLVSNTAATALAVIAFQGAGYNHREFQYKDVVRGGIDALVQSQKENGDLFVPLDDESNRSVWLYSHSLATIALCEAYGMTHDPALKEPAQRAIDFIAAGQHQGSGGWRYSPGVGADTSVSGWMMMALKSGQLAGLDVPSATFAKIGLWLDRAQQSRAEPHLYRYNPDAPNTPEQRHGRTASKTMTSVGLLMRLYTGWKRDNPNMIRGAQYLAEHPPAIGAARDPQRDTYYWYYATQVMAHMGGERWHAWNNRLHPLIVNAQVRQGPYAGSWDPQAPLPDRWGPHAGRLYVTTMNLLSLEVQYRKLPLYEDTIK